MTGAELEKLHTLTHYRDAAGRAMAERRQTDRRGTDRREVSRPPAELALLHRSRQGACCLCQCPARAEYFGHRVCSYHAGIGEDGPPCPVCELEREPYGAHICMFCSGIGAGTASELLAVGWVLDGISGRGENMCPPCRLAWETE